MATNHTTNYQLNLWEASDNFVREEFNENSQKIDAAIKAVADSGDARGASVNQQLNLIRSAIEQLGTAGIFTHEYVGNGGKTRYLPLVHRPMVVFLWAKDGSLPVVTAFYGCAVTTSPDVTISEWPDREGLTEFTGAKYNEKGKTYIATAVTNNIF